MSMHIYWGNIVRWEGAWVLGWVGGFLMTVEVIYHF